MKLFKAGVIIASDDSTALDDVLRELTECLADHYGYGLEDAAVVSVQEDATVSSYLDPPLQDDEDVWWEGFQQWFEVQVNSHRRKEGDGT